MKVEFLEGTTEKPLSMIGKMAGVCWNTDTSSEEKNVKRGKECCLANHGRTMEYPEVCMCISGVSARVAREWYTHIGGMPTRLQESTRYVDCSKFEYMTPDFKNANYDAALTEYVDAMESAREHYEKLLSIGVSREDAANVLPLGMNTKIVVKHNLRNLVDMMHTRLCNRTYYEFRNILYSIIWELSNKNEEWKWIVDNLFVPKCKVLGKCPEKHGCGKFKKP